VKPDRADEIIARWRIELPEIAGLGLELAKRTARLGAILDAATSAELGKMGLTRAEYEILATLRRAGRPYRLTPTELTGSLLLSSGGTSNVIRRMVDAGYVTREANEQDGRSSWVQLTNLGVRVAENAVRRSVAAHDALMQRIPKRSARSLNNLLRDALVALGDAVDEDTAIEQAPEAS
jgi:DNA-binding MarR family transcriptional regulator